MVSSRTAAGGRSPEWAESLLDVQASTYVRMNTSRAKVPFKRDEAVMSRIERSIYAWAQVKAGERSMYSYMVAGQRRGILKLD